IRRQGPEILRLVGLQGKIQNHPDQLSGGEQQRVSIARAFVNHPPLLLADETTGNLAPETSIGIMQLLYRINKTGTTVVVATHDHAMVDRMRRRVVELSRGRIVRDEVGGQYAPRDLTPAEIGGGRGRPSARRGPTRRVVGRPPQRPRPGAAPRPARPGAGPRAPVRGPVRR